MLARRESEFIKIGAYGSEPNICKVEIGITGDSLRDFVLADESRLAMCMLSRCSYTIGRIMLGSRPGNSISGRSGKLLGE